MDETGLLSEPFFSHGVSVFAGNKEAFLTQEDIRSLQKAKAAIRAGIELLTERQGMPEKLYLAGGFGFFLNPADAVRIGLIPEELESSCVPLGNGVLPGLMRYYAFQGQGEEELISSVRALNLAELEGFAESYIGYMNFPTIEG